LQQQYEQQCPLPIPTVHTSYATYSFTLQPFVRIGIIISFVVFLIILLSIYFLAGEGSYGQQRKQQQ
jgi:hypothetical protein